MKRLARPLAWLCWLACLAIPLLFFWGRMDDASYKGLLAAASVGWFVFAAWGMTGRSSS